MLFKVSFAFGLNTYFYGNQYPYAMLKSTCLVFAIQLLAFVLPAQNIEDLAAYEKSMMPGTQLTYDVNSGGKKYQLIATLKKAGEEISFFWKTTESTPRSGTVSVTNTAVTKADALNNYFTGGDTKLDKETALFLSQKMFNDISSTSAANIKVNGASDTTTALSNTIGEFNFNLNGNLVAIPGWELQGGSDIKYTVQVLESFKFPLIYLLDIGWTMQLAEVKMP